MWIPGPKLTQVFASRWKALFWAGSVLGSVYFFVSHSGGEDKAGPQADQQAASIAQQLVGGGSATSAASSAPLSPWAADSAAS